MNHVLNSSQRQLLQLLSIQPLQLKNCFQPQTDKTPVAMAVDDSAGEIFVCPQVNHPLVQDLAVLLQQEPATTPQALQLGALRWSIQPGSTECSLSGHQLISPELSSLTSPVLKRQLWHCISPYLDAND
ncbi:hypothetical protein SAMN04488051_1183 [Alkalimonas amylolytica]|uniref:DNA polymerase III subunit psi n=1 Tax=Alkalimonas amylolytica TaxID=152573 RepID=A0A1H4G398_ALKAM|nr:hypothetical protein SAMN04488051_1183 [Alkalimonas amylolytica]